MITTPVTNISIMITTLLLALCFGAALFYWRTTPVSNPRGLPLPPGPKPDPIIGNARHIPLEESWVTFARWKDTYGDIIHLNAMGQRIIVLNSFKVISDLVGQRSIYADRPYFYIISELMGLGKIVGLLPYGDTWKRHRKLLHSVLGKNVITQHRSVQQRHARWYLQTLLEKPEDFIQSLRLLAGKSVIRVAYGIDVHSAKDTCIILAEEAIDRCIKAMDPHYALLNALPILKYTPSWLPGFGIKGVALRQRPMSNKMVDLPFEDVKNRLASGMAIPSLVSAALQEEGCLEEDIKWASGSMYTAGADTIYAALCSFFLAMTTNPGVREKAQAEIDRAVGGNRLPRLEDRTKMPYLECVLKEILRWGTIAPFSVPRRLLEDDYYDGYWIPRGSTVLPNLWAIAHDKTIYKEPERFWPERFEGEAGKDVLDPTLYSYGFGRRICPGLHFADSMLFITMASILATYDITKPRNEDGQEIDPVISYHSGLLYHLNPFECTIKPRSPTAQALIEAEVAC
ncbi:hypothetical protein BOTBODRAFT_31081 [Botryobasidium botryosum FD-172 SS1]|uniref:Cytochrome P450 n=1 Tax=Botryobasidium botryosum (strain FD-172 SS1) TaxID=930990 RepID=A0A067MKX9_BOTB1|nr:hypothetical protein BOTBODRAFT_31081 [Botryobasidium botryosum FD-172 SS1]